MSGAVGLYSFRMSDASTDIQGIGVRAARIPNLRNGANPREGTGPMPTSALQLQPPSLELKAEVIYTIGILESRIGGSTFWILAAV